MQILEVSGAVRPLQGSLGVKGLIKVYGALVECFKHRILSKNPAKVLPCPPHILPDFPGNDTLLSSVPPAL